MQCPLWEADVPQYLSDVRLGSQATKELRLRRARLWCHRSRWQPTYMGSSDPADWCRFYARRCRGVAL